MIPMFVTLYIVLIFVALWVELCDSCLSEKASYEGVSKSFEPQAFSPFR